MSGHNGFAHAVIPGSSNSINTYVPLQYATFSGTYGSRTYNLKVTDAQGNVTFATLPIEYFCPELFVAGPLSAQRLMNSKMSIYPNPNTGSFQIDLNIKEEQDINITLLNINGQSISTIFRARLSEGSHTLNYNSNYKMPAGMYLISLKGKSINKIQKIQIQ